MKKGKATAPTRLPTRRASKRTTKKEAVARKPRKSAAFTAATEGFPIVAIGASAGGLEAFEQFFAHMPSDSNLAFVLIPHLDPSRVSMMKDLLKSFTKMKIFEADDGVSVRPNCVYVIPPNREMAIHHRVLRVTAPAEPRGLRMPIDLFFRSLAEDQGEHAICIILSGTGSDGTLGMRAIHGVGGICFVQEPTTARFAGMPASAIQTGLTDFVLPTEKMPEQLLFCVQHLIARKDDQAADLWDRTPEGLKRILTLIHSRTGHDFSLYKKNTILRRIEKRITVHGIPEVSDYIRFLQDHPDEVGRLFKELLIVVTRFFRDPEAFEFFQSKVLPRLLKDKPDNYPLRVWVPACATGEEVYSLAMMFRDYMDTHKQEFRVQIFGTDLDESAIRTARAAVYPGSIAADVSPERLRRFFVNDNALYRVRKDIREMAVFAVQNVVRDAPFTRMDLISCRNLMIYLGTELQGKLLSLFHYSLKPDGILFLGESETIGTHVDLYSTVDKKRRFYRRKGIEPSDRVQVFPSPGRTEEVALAQARVESTRAAETAIVEAARAMLLQHFCPPCVIVNDKGDILYVHGHTGKYLEPAAGRATLNVIGMAREGLAPDLRAALHTAHTKSRDVRCRNVAVRANGKFRSVNVVVKPLTDPGTTKGLMMIVFEDVHAVEPESAAARKQPARAGGKRMEALERELHHSREDLQATVEEMQASNEELQSTNEELQSTNEELETSEEELQSVNEELITVNSELQIRVDQLTRAENDMKNLLDAIKIGTIFLDADLKIKRFTAESAKVVNLIPTDIGRPISHLVTNLEYPDLVRDAETVRDKLVFKEATVRSKDDNWYLVRIMPHRTTENVFDGVVMTFTEISKLKHDTEELGRMTDAVHAARHYAECLIETARQPFVLLDTDLRVQSANRTFCSFFNVRREETEGRLLFELGSRQWDIPELRQRLGEALSTNAPLQGFEVNLTVPGVGAKHLLLDASQVVAEQGGPSLLLLGIAEVTDSKNASENEQK